MSAVKARIELFFEQLARTLYTHPITTLLLMSLLLVLIFSKIPDLTVDTNTEALLRDTDPSKIIYNQFRDQFGQDRMIVVAIKADNLFSEDFFTRLKAFHQEIDDRVPHVDTITSLINARNTRGEADRLIVEELLEGWPEERQVDFDRLQEQVLANPAFVNQIISADGLTTAVVIKPVVYSVSPDDMPDALDFFDDDMAVATPEKSGKQPFLSQQESDEMTAAVEAVIAGYHSPDFFTAFAGAPVVMSVFNEYTMKDLRRCFLLSIIVTIFFLAALFRRASGVILPQIVVNAAVFSTLGLMAWFDVPVKMTTTVLPAFLLCVGVADSVHILAIFYKQVDEGHSKADAIAYAMGHSGLAVLMTTMTTSAALLSFSFAELTAMGELGLFAAIGVNLAFLYTITLLPALIAFAPVKRKPEKSVRDGVLMDRILLGTSAFSTRHPVGIIFTSLVIFAVSFHFIFDLRYSDHVVNYFPETLPIRHDLDFIDEHLNGALNIEIIIDTGRENGIYEPDILNRIERMQYDLEQRTFDDITIGNVSSINDILKEIHQALHGGDPEYYVIPQDYNTIAQEFLLFENTGADDLEPIVDTRFSMTRVSVKTHWVDSVYVNAFITELNHYLSTLFKDRAEVQITGMSALMARSISAALNSMTRSYILAFVVIALMMILLVGEVKTGLFAMIPNIIPIVLTLGIMGALNVPMDITSLMIASIAMGLVVDDTVHFIYNFQKYHLRTGDARVAVNLTMSGVGRALLVTTIVLSCGFFVTIFATLSHTFRFGIFAGMTIIFALIAVFLLAPALMMVITGTYRWPGRRRSEAMRQSAAD